MKPWDTYWRVQLVCKKIQAYSSLEPPLEYRRIIRFMLLIQTKKRFLWTMAAVQAAENHGDEWGLIWYLLSGIYTSIPLTTFTSISRSAKFKDILPWNISQMIIKTVPISTRIVISYAIKRVSHCEFDGKPMETETKT